MINKKIKEKIKKLPDEPGVYKFLKGKKILYIGKATSLRDRVRSYFSGKIEETRGPLIYKMISEIDDIKFQKTDSVLEALILEANLIKKHQPPANTIDKDDKSFNFIVITDENFPRVLIIRGRELEKILSPHSSKSTDIFLLKNSSCSAQSASQGFSRKDSSEFFGFAKIFGPFPNGGQLKEAMKIVRKMFPFRDKCEPGKGKPCFNRQINLCPGICTGEISKKEYAKQIKNIVLFFEGKKRKLITNLEKEMKKSAKFYEFEKADKVKKQIFALNHIKDVALIKSDTAAITKNNFRIEAYDIAHLSGTNMVGVMVVIENGEAKKSDYRKFKIKEQNKADDTRALSEILTRRFNHNEWPLPNFIVVDGGIAQINAAKRVIKESGIQIPVVSVVKDEKHKPKKIMSTPRQEIKNVIYKKEILQANTEAHRFAISFHRYLRKKNYREDEHL